MHYNHKIYKHMLHDSFRKHEMNTNGHIAHNNVNTKPLKGTQENNRHTVISITLDHSGSEST